MVIIRLQRVGRRNHAEFRIVATESTRAPKANYIELLGTYSPHTNTVQLEADRVREWIAKGAQVSDTVNNILVSEKVIEGKKINVLPKKTPIIKEVPQEVVKEEKKVEQTEEKKEEAPAVEEAPAAEEAPAEAPAESEQAPAEEPKQ